MSKVVLMISISLDGYFEGPNRELDWHLVDEELHQHFNDYLRTNSAFLEGRITHELMAGYWPTADQDPASTPVEAEFAGIWRDMRKYVYSRTLDHADWNATLLRDVVPEEVIRLKEESTGDLALGGADLAASFLRLGLVDELRIYVHPVVIGTGRLPFADDARLDLDLLETHRFSNGVVLLRYEVRRSGADPRPS